MSESNIIFDSLTFFDIIMPSFRFRIPFFSSVSSSRRLSSGTPPPPPPPSSRPPFRPAGIAQPSREATPSETKSKVPPSVSKSNVAAISASSSTSHSPSSSAATPNRLVKETNQSGSPLKKMESLRTEDHKVTLKEKSSGETNGENNNGVIEKPPITRPREHLEKKESESVQEQRKKTEVEKLALQERRKVLPQVSVEKEKEKLASQETARGSKDPPERKTKTQNRTENHDKTKGASTSNNGNKRVLNGEGSSSMSRKIKEDIRGGINKLTWGTSNRDDKSVSVITLTGENRGATMAIASEKDKKDDEIHIHRGYRSKPDESPNTTATASDTEGGRKQHSNGGNPKDEDEEETTFKAYVNGNAQGINNSIVLESSVSENDPGVHMSLKFVESKKKMFCPKESAAVEKSETVTEKTKNEPRVRRRCLRGLLAESTESEPENPLKPRRHGCRFTCKDKDIENI